MGQLFVLAILVIAAGLVIFDAALLVRREWHDVKIREAFRARVLADLARDRIVHDQADGEDYLDRIRPVFDPVAPHKGPWRTYGKPRFVARASAQTGKPA